MKISSYQPQNIHSLRQAVGIANLNRAMNQDKQSINNIKKQLEQSVTPTKGGNIDIKV